ncbi:MAG: Hemagglutinin/hemolysin-related protein [Myxococcaceae bacterium]|nr:Hemagglutinin/hemolysin-related protein [Myxococcaceae bacterium]
MGKHVRTGWSRGVLLCLLATTGCDCGSDTREGTGDDGDGGANLHADASAADASARGDGSTQSAECRPGAQTCSAGMATFCRDDGTLARYECDPDQGLTCTPGGCQGACDLSEVHDSYIGCDYYPTVTLNPVWSGFTFAVAVSNTTNTSSHVKITRGASVVQEAEVGPNQLKTFDLPWVPELKGGDISCTLPPSPGDSRVVAAGAYRVRTTQPVTVYQFSPLEYQITPAPAQCPTIIGQCADSQVSDCFSYSNDASLLLPATALTGNYTVLSWPSQSEGSGFVAVTATQDGTEVQVTGRGEFAGGTVVTGAGNGKVRLDRGGVLELVAGRTGDVSGTRIRANKPVQVLSGHSCAYVPTAGTANCDHLEEVMFPEDTLGKKYVVTTPFYADHITPTPYVLRAAATTNETHVSFDPKVHDDVVLSAGTFVEVQLAGATPPNVVISSDQPLLVAQYMVGQAALPVANALGDPSLSTAVAVEQYRTDYLFTAPISYPVNIATVIAKHGAQVKIDGKSIAASEYVTVGSSEYGVANVLLNGASAVHSLTSDQEVGLTVYGYGQFTSYMYPGGADLARIAVPIAI